MMPPLVLDVSDVQHIMEISRKSSYEFVYMPRFPAFRSGRLFKISKKAFFDWMAGVRENNARNGDDV